MNVTELGMVMLVSETQLMNAKSPILVTESGMVIFLRKVQPLNSDLSMVFPFKITTSFSFLRGIFFNILSGTFAYSIGHLMKESLPTFTSKLDMVTLVNEVQPANA